MSGPLTWSQGSWLVGDAAVGIGDSAHQSELASADHDGDGDIETNLDELAGLLDTTIDVQVDSAGELRVIDGRPYR
jgi:hypothetical protein